jgi:hypothetical protein
MERVVRRPSTACRARRTYGEGFVYGDFQYAIDET